MIPTGAAQSFHRRRIVDDKRPCLAYPLVTETQATAVVRGGFRPRLSERMDAWAGALKSGGWRVFVTQDARAGNGPGVCVWAKASQCERSAHRTDRPAGRRYAYPGRWLGRRHHDTRRSRPIVSSGLARRAERHVARRASTAAGRTVPEGTGMPSRDGIPARGQNENLIVPPQVRGSPTCAAIKPVLPPVPASSRST